MCINKTIFLNIPNFDSSCFEYLTGRTSTFHNTKIIQTSDNHRDTEDRLFKIKLFNHDYTFNEDLINGNKTLKEEYKQKYIQEINNNIGLFRKHFDY